MKSRHFLFPLTTVSFCFAAFSQQSTPTPTPIGPLCPNIEDVSHISCTLDPKNPDIKPTSCSPDAPAGWSVGYFKEGYSENPNPMNPNKLNLDLSNVILYIEDNEKNYPCGISTDQTKPPEIFHVTSFSCQYQIYDTDKNLLNLTIEKQNTPQIYIKTSEWNTDFISWPKLPALNPYTNSYYLGTAFSCQFPDQNKTNCFKNLLSYSSCPNKNVSTTKKAPK